MLSKIVIKNFKCFDNVEIELASPVIFIGPNNSGKTSALQALALWEIGLRRWSEKRKESRTPEKRPGVTINRRDLVSIPVPNANLLWRDLHVRKAQKTNGSQNIRIDIIVEGVTNDKLWKCGLEFDYANEESFYCRPIRLTEGKDPDRMAIPNEAMEIQMAFLSPMSGLVSSEVRLDPGAINVRVGEGRTAEVLRNICYQLYEKDKDSWNRLKTHIERLFSVKLSDPLYISERGEIEMNYSEKGGELDISCSGRGLQQTLLLLSYMYANKGSVLLLDEPDAHLEILRQQQIYQYLTDVARENKNQIIAASHSEVLLREAAEKDTVIAFLGKPHRINDRGSQLLKSLRDINFEDYYLAEQKGWVLYLEGSTDLAILKAFAERLKYQEAIEALERPFVVYVGNQTQKMFEHFYGLREAVPNLKGAAIFDRLLKDIDTTSELCTTVWRKREIENYLCFPETLEAFAMDINNDDLFSNNEQEKRLKAMRKAIAEVESALKTLSKGSPWDNDTKVSDDFLKPLFENYFAELGIPNVMEKKNFHDLARFVPLEKIDPEVKEKLDLIVNISKLAEPKSP
ncbi:MAG: ATP-dependent nuclease [bacterium]